MAGYIHPNRVRRPSERIRIKYSFCNFKNTAENPVLIDMEEHAKKASVQMNGEDEVHKKVEIEAHTPEATAMEVDVDNFNNVRRSRKRKDTKIESEHINVSGVELLMVDLKVTENERDKGKASAGIVDQGHDSYLSKRKQMKVDHASSSRKTRSHTREMIRMSIPQKKDKPDVQGHNKSAGSSSIKTKLNRSIHHKRGKLNMKQPHQNSGSQMRRGLEVIRTRTSPKALHDAIVALSSSQKEAVRKMGLESLLSMEIDGVPSKLGFYLVDNLDTTEMGIRVSNGVLPVTVESIHKLTGLPTGGIDLLAENDVPSDQNLIAVWKKQFKVPKIRPKHVADLIKEKQDSGFHFKINFMVLFVNLMIEGNSMGTVNLKFLAKIKSDDMTGKVDWCKFVYDKVRTSKRRWRRDNLLCFYSGPLTYLALLYVDSTLSASDEVDRKGMPICVWNMGLLKKRERIELRDGGFGLLPLKGNDNSDNEGGNDSLKVNDASLGGNKAESSKATTNVNDVSLNDDTMNDATMHDAPNLEEANLSEPNMDSEKTTDPSKEDLLKEIKDKISRLIALKVGLDFDLDNGLEKYRDDAELISLKWEVSRLFMHESDSGNARHAAENESPHGNESNWLVLSQKENEMDEKMWSSPNFIREIEEIERLSVQKTNRMTSLNTIKPLNFNSEVTPTTGVGARMIATSSSDASGLASKSNEGKTNRHTRDIDPLDFDMGISPVKLTVPLTLGISLDNRHSKVMDRLGFDMGISPDKPKVPLSLGISGDNRHTVPLSMVNSRDNNTSQASVEIAGMISTITSVSKGKNKVIEPKKECTDNDVNLIARASKRTIKPGDHLKSPYAVRVLDFNVTTEDDRVHDWAVAMFGSKYDAVFSAINCTNITRTGMESLAVGNMTVDTSVINGWASILNFEERLRSRNSPRRYFFRIDIMMDHMLRARSYNIEEQYNVFKKALVLTTRHAQGHIHKLKDIDLAFFPMLDGAYYYLVVINLKAPSFIILDNRKWKQCKGEALKKRYGGITDVLQRMVVKHLYTVGHGSAQQLLAVEQERLEMDWQTSHNTHDSGVFMMRSMETFMGDVRCWKPGFMEEGQRLTTQLADLRKRYTTRIAKHGQNLKRDDIIKEITRITNMADDIKNELIRQSVDSRWERL